MSIQVQIYETEWGDEEGVPYGPVTEFMDMDDAGAYCDLLGQQHEGYLYIPVRIEEKEEQ